MSVFEGLGKRLSATGKITVVTAKKFAGSAKTSASISEEKKKIDGAYREIGRLYYDKFKDCPDPDLRELIGIIRTAKENIEEAKKEQEERNIASQNKMEQIRSELEDEMLRKFDEEHPPAGNYNGDPEGVPYTGSEEYREDKMTDADVQMQNQDASEGSKMGRRIDL